MNKIICCEIQNWVSRANDEFEQICNRFERLDASLSNLEIARAYIAHAYADEFDPLDTTSMKIDAMIKNHQLENAFQLAWETACKDLFNLSVMDSILKLVPQTHEIWKVVGWRYTHLLRAITSTGDGTSPETAFCVASVNDEYIILHGVLELHDASSQRLKIINDRAFDVISVTPTASFPHEEVYFEITSFYVW